MPGRVRYEITHPFPIIIGTTDEVGEWINNFSLCISLVHETIDDMHFSTGDSIIPTVRELPVNSLDQLYAFLLLYPMTPANLRNFFFMGWDYPAAHR